MIEPNRDLHRTSSTRFGPATANVPSRPPQPWMFYALAAGGLWHLVLGVAIVVAPTLLFPLGPEASIVVRICGVFAIAWGVGSFTAASDAHRHWPTVLTGLVGLAGAAGLCIVGNTTGAIRGVMPIAVAAVSLGWAVTLVAILRIVWRDAEEFPSIRRFYPFMRESILQTVVTHRGDRLLDLSNRQPLLLVFLRHSGCTFCREAMAALATDQPRIARLGTRIVLVHMSEPAVAEENARRFGLDDVDFVANQDQSLYWAFGLRRGRFNQLFGPRVLWRGFVAGVLRRLGLGGIDGDGYQMPGVFLFSHGRVERHFVHRSAADCPDYVALAMPAPPPPAAAARAVESR